MLDSGPPDLKYPCKLHLALTHSDLTYAVWVGGGATIRYSME